MMKSFVGLYPVIFLCLAMSLLGGAAAYWGKQQASKAQQAFEQNARQLRQMQDERGQFQKNAVEMRQTAQWFQALRDKGFFRPHTPQDNLDRLEWVAFLRQARSRQGIASLHYEFQPPQVLQDGSGHFSNSALTLFLGLNHELELEPFLRELADQPQVRVRVQECEMQKNPDASDVLRLGPNLLVKCELDWITGQLTEKAAP
jgi:hypothetical protein